MHDREDEGFAPLVSAPKAWGVATYPPGASFGPRYMRDYEFVWMIEGDATYRVGDAEWDVPVDSIVLCQPGLVDTFFWDTHRRTRHGFFHFDIDALPAYLPPRSAWPVMHAPHGDDILRPMFRHLLAWMERGSKEQIRLGLSHLLTAFVSGETAAQTVRSPVYSDAVEVVLKTIYERLDLDPAAAIPLHHLADTACVTPEHLCRLFKAETGHAPAETVRLARLDRAAALVARSNYTFSEIAALHGFSDAFHFSRLFKAAFGRSPSIVRRESRAGRMPPLPKLIEIVR